MYGTSLISTKVQRIIIIRQIKQDRRRPRPSRKRVPVRIRRRSREADSASDERARKVGTDKSDGRPTTIRAITIPFWGSEEIMSAEAQLRRYALTAISGGRKTKPRNEVPMIIARR